MAKLFTFEQLRELSEHQTPGSVSLYFATGIQAVDADKRRLEIKNLLTSFLKMDPALLPSACREKIQAINPKDDAIGTYGAGTRIYFISPERQYQFEIPVQLEPKVKFNDRFYITPLIRLWRYEKPHYLLKLSMQHVELFLVTGLRWEKITFKVPMLLQDAYSPDVDEWSLKKFNKIRDVYKNQNRDDMMAQGSDDRYFGTSKADRYDVRDSEMVYFLKHIDMCLMETIEKKTAPLILAADENVARFYRDLSQYPLIHKSMIRGNPDHFQHRQLQQKAVGLIQEIIDQKSETFLREFANLNPSAHATDDIDKLELAARSGFIKTLLIRQVMDQEESRLPSELVHHPEQLLHEGMDEKINRIASHTLANGGQIHWFQPGVLPTKAPAAAVLHSAL
ncbi:MAG: hypothetical protein ACOH5I_22400 [Oligoflexus sp.]